MRKHRSFPWRTDQRSSPQNSRRAATPEGVTTVRAVNTRGSQILQRESVKSAARLAYSGRFWLSFFFVSPFRIRVKTCPWAPCPVRERDARGFLRLRLLHPHRGCYESNRCSCGETFVRGNFKRFPQYAFFKVSLHMLETLQMR